jgi:hypothetical protein
MTTMSTSVQAQRGRLSPRGRSALAISVLLAIAAPALARGADTGTPPPVSGRRLSDPASVLPADVLARVELVRANVALIRRYMGKPPPPAALLRVEGAQPREVYSQALNLEHRANRLTFEQVRIVRSESIPMRDAARPADVFAVVDSALAAVMLVKREMGIGEAVAEQIRPEATTPSEVFNATIAAGSELNQLLDQQTSPSDVFQLVTAAVHSAASLHADIPGGPKLPLEPPFEPDKAPADVFGRVERCFDLIRQIAASLGVETLRFEVSAAHTVTPNDVADLAALVLEELDHLHLKFPDARAPARAYHPGKRFPSHVDQRAGLLERILADLARHRGGARAAAGG